MVKLGELYPVQEDEAELKRDVAIAAELHDGEWYEETRAKLKRKGYRTMQITGEFTFEQAQMIKHMGVLVRLSDPPSKKEALLNALFWFVVGALFGWQVYYILSHIFTGWK